MPLESESLDLLCVNTLRTLAMDAVQKANSGHPGLPMGAAPMAYVLWSRHLRHDPSDPSWMDRDRFVLSAGHGSMLLYALLHLSGYDLSMSDLQSFRQWGSRTPGHPEFGLTPGVEATTGPLGQGSANAVGMAIAERALAHRFNRPGHTLVDHWTYALVSDGDLMEGISGEAASLAGHLKLGKLVYLYDANGVSLDGPLSLAFSTEDVGRRYEAYGWQVLQVEDGDTDLSAIDAALVAARGDTQRPSLIVVRTTLGYGSPNKAGKAAAHGSPLGRDEVRLAKQALGWDPGREFFVPDAARARFQQAAARGAAAHAAWRVRREAWEQAHPELATQWRRAVAGELSPDWDAALPSWKASAPVATRSAAGKALNALAAGVPELLGGDADLSSSTKTALDGAGSFEGTTGAGRNLHFGVREHAMAAIANGMAYHGGVRPYTATFFCFSDYMRPAVRLAALSELPVVHVWTHDSVAVGEDGPTHQPVEHLMALRAIPGFSVVRPADANEAAEAWRAALLHRDGPVGLVLTRQDLPVLDVPAERLREGVARGAYVVAGPTEGRVDALLLATGSEVHLAIAAQRILAAEGIAARAISMPCCEWFAAQPSVVRDAVLPPAVRARVSIEAGVTFGWHRWIGDSGVAVGIDRFGASAPGETVQEQLGLTATRVVEAVRDSLRRASR